MTDELKSNLEQLETHWFNDADCSELRLKFRTYEDACLFSMWLLDKGFGK